MFAGHQIVTPAIAARFRAPYDAPVSPLSRYARGGVALNDSSLGRDNRNWVVWYDEPNQQIKYGTEVKPITALGSYAWPDVLQLSLAFDNNMNPTLNWLDADGAHHRYFSAGTSSYVNLTVTGATSSLAVVDDVRRFNNANSDIVWAYTLPSGLWFRLQRENYATPRQLSSNPKELLRLGMNIQNRLQFEIKP